MQTEDLIARLAQEAKPVRRMASPARLTAGWLLMSAPVLAAVVLMMGPRPHLVALLAQPRFALAEGLAVLTTIVSAYAAFCAGRPDEPGWKLALPILAFVAWLGELGRQCFVLSVQTHGAALVLHADWMCIPVIAVTSLVPAVAIVWLLRRSALFRATEASLCATLAATAAAEAVLPLFHTADTMMMVLVWQMGSVALLTALGALAARMGLGRGKT
jgi:hypothetical protein